MRVLGLAGVLLYAALFFAGCCDINGRNEENISGGLAGALRELVAGVEGINSAGEDDYSAISSFKAKIRACLENISNDEEAQAVSERFLDLIIADEDVVAADYYLIWLGNAVLTEYPSKESAKLHRLVDKANNAESAIGDEAHAEWVMMVADLLQELLPQNSGNNAFIVDGKLDQEQWRNVGKMIDDR